MLRNSIWRNSKFLVVGVLAIALAGGGFWNWQRQKVAEQRQEMEVQSRRENLAREGRQERAWRKALAIRAAASNVFPTIAYSEVWRAAQMDVARDQPVREMLRDLEVAFVESKAAAEKTQSSKQWLIAGDIGYALYRVTEARTCYQRSHLAPDAGSHPDFMVVSEHRAAELLHDLGAYEQGYAFWKFAYSVADSTGNPAFAVEVAIRFGKCSQALRREADALGSLRSALARVEGLTGRDAVEVVEPLGRLSVALTTFGKFPEAELATQRLVQLSETHFGKDGYRTALSLLVQGELLADQGRWSDLETVVARASEILRKTVAEEHPAALATQSLAGLALLSSNRPMEAEAVYRKLLERAEACLPHDHVLVGVITGQLGHTVRAQDRKAEAEGLYRGAVDILGNSSGEEHSSTVEYAASFGQMLASMHRMEEAEVMLRRAYRIVTKKYGVGDPKVAKAGILLADFLKQTNRSAEADELMNQSAQLLSNSPTPSSTEDQISILVSRSDSLKLARRIGEAEAALREALSMAEDSLPADSVPLAMVLNNLGLLLAESERGTEAERYLRRSLEIHLKVQGPDHNMVADTLVNLAGIAHGRGQSDEALRLSRRALEIYEISYGKEHPRVAIALSNLAYFLRELGRYDEAENAQRRAVQVAEKCFGPESAEVAIRLKFLGAILQSAGREKDAEPIMRRVQAIGAKEQRGSGR